MPTTELDRRCANALRVLAMDGVQRANSGHPGLPMGMADVAYILWTRHLRHNPKSPTWPNRDRFILSAGHGSMLLYSLLHLTGYAISRQDLMTFRQWQSRTPGHPERAPELGIEATTGPLGQGFANGVGMAIAAKHQAAVFNRPGFAIVDPTIYAIVSDGEMMEGISHEAASLAGHLGLDNLLYLYDDNGISIEGATDLTFTEDVAARFRAYGWHVQAIDGHNVDAIDGALRAARSAKGQPHLIVCRTTIGFGSPTLQGSADAHGAPLGEEEVQRTKEALGWPSLEPFYVPDDVVTHYRLAVPQGAQLEARWRDLLNGYAQAYPAEAKELRRVLSGALPARWDQGVPAFRAGGNPIATRSASGKVLNALATTIPELMGGSADLEPSNKTAMSGVGDFQKQTPQGRNLHFGVREHAMGGVLNGMALFGGLRVYGGTFLVFSDYMRPSVRLAAMMKLPIIYIWTHDSIYVGEDGPTHQPVEQLMSLRLIPGLTVIRPADANETAAAWKVALARTDGPTALILTRQNLPIITLPVERVAEGVSRGAYVVSDSPFDRIDVLLIASGSEVTDALAAQALLTERRVGARVISMPSWELFSQQSVFYKLSVLPPQVNRRLAIEAGVTLGWERYTGTYGTVLGIDRYGASAPHTVLKHEVGITPEAIAEAAQKILAES